MAAPGPKAKDIDPDTLKALSSIGCTQDEIAEVVGMSSRQLRRRYKGPMQSGRHLMSVSIRRHLFGLMKSGNVAATIFLGKCVLGMNEYAGAAPRVEETKVVRVFGAYDARRKKKKPEGGKDAHDSTP